MKRLPFPQIRFLALILPLLTLSRISAAPEQWKAEIDRFTAADAAHPPQSQGVLFVGSSTIRKWTSLAKDFPAVPVINRGFGGSELSDSVFYADRIAIPYRPRLIVVYAGDNDLARGKTPAIVHGDFRAFCAKIHAALPQTRILFVAIKPSPSREKLKDKIIAANGLKASGPMRIVTNEFTSDSYSFDVVQPVSKDGQTEGAWDVKTEAEVVFEQLPAGRAATTDYTGYATGLESERQVVRAWALVNGASTRDRAYEEYLVPVPQMMTEDAKFKVYWPVK